MTTLPEYGFTGTRQGLTEFQRIRLCRLFKSIAARGKFVLHHGGAIGADATAHAAAAGLGAFTVVHPCHVQPGAPVAVLSPMPHAIRPTAAPLVRNRAIVKASRLLIACPRGFEEELRSGTWATIRYAMSQGVRLRLVYPDGTVGEAPW